MAEKNLWQIEPQEKEMYPALSCLTKLKVQLNKEESHSFGGTTYGYYRVYDSGDYRFRFFFGRTLGGAGKQLFFELYFKGNKIASDVIKGNRAEAFACFLRNITE